MFRSGVVAEVVFDNGIKTVRVRSTVEVKNMLSVPMVLRFQSGSEVIQVSTVQPGQSLWAPLQAAAHGVLRVAPYIPGGTTPGQYAFSFSGAINLEVEQSPQLWSAQQARVDDESHVLTMCCDRLSTARGPAVVRLVVGAACHAFRHRGAPSVGLPRLVVDGRPCALCAYCCRTLMSALGAALKWYLLEKQSPGSP